ncbi:hypothetical protein [Micromonospora sp. NPDC023956]|uniref:hypothetical protein n=1 Tax=Micromonospora sp. NPDC023956 TaxID=3155722 RepID=UPI0034005DE8
MTVTGREHRRSGADPPFWNERNWVLSAVFLAGAVLLATVVWLTRDTGADPADPGPAAVERRPAEAGACPPGRTVASGPAVPPGDVTWRTLDAGKRVPVSASEGPSTAGPVLRCFARTPMGAVLAAHVIPTQLGGPEWRAVADRQVVTGRGREVLVARLDAATGSTAVRGGGSYAGYALLRYAPEAARVQVLVRSGSGGYVATVVELRWDGGDWKVAPTRTGAVHTSAEVITGSAGFTLWRS